MAAETITDTNTAGLCPAPQRLTKKQVDSMKRYPRSARGFDLGYYISWRCVIRNRAVERHF